jgi:hypothetical protein
MICIYEDIQKKQSDVTHLPCFPRMFSIQVNWVPGISVKITSSEIRPDRHCMYRRSLCALDVTLSECLTIHNVAECCPLQPKHLLYSVLKRTAHG